MATETVTLRVYPVWIEAVATALQEIFRSPLPADTVLQQFFRKHRKMGKRDRAFVAETVYGMLRHYRRLAHAARRRADDLRFLTLLYLEVFGFGEAKLDLPVRPAERGALEAAARRFREPALPNDPAAALGILYSLPDWLVAAWLEVLPREAVEARCAALKAPAPLTIRVNTLKADRETVRQRLLAEGFPSRPTPYSPVGLILEEKAFIFRTRAFQEGLFEVQDEGSQLISLLTGARPGQVVVDGCAGGGGKTLHLAALMEGRGRLYAFDIHEARLRELRPRARRADVHNVRLHVLPHNRASIVRRLYGKADAVLVDAPCSGTGVLRRNPDAAWKITPERVAALVEQQRQILEAYAPLVRPGGRLVYATCSLLPAENEHQVHAFLEKHPEFTLLSTAEVLARQGIALPHQTDAFLRIEPATHGTDGFFAAVLVRS
ncbi:Fmu (Sun) domain protein [Rhodothermus marinus SG0.5JP17-172]|jgi:16S rRNA (cytosine967-C5)-methyltransferase|uniref:RsmB/NOP family class I SAM-dependent RNA methyltransferase n=1 Tax=Rhodothermus marinus TaxID=29549 RepID=UPI000223D728|nr:RsmB/NOP family class I SAM-dependent RNA methyltransferase [Rhodothermus marinus]AEN72289.1 Fmu (Sun) domain protein [Rhodothermus marinus SG0.5JP17-172]MBO2491978.1 RsmB/NOP family class I SAM-dependent RNA methyltransferase [Rhodothermus marinus]